MASNILKRIFGETKLELKLLLLFAAGLLVIISTAFWWYGRRTKRLVYEKNEEVGRALVDLFMMSVHANETEPNAGDGDRSAFVLPSPDDERKQRAEENPLIKKMYQDFVTSKHKPKFIYYWKGPQAGGPEDEFERELCDKYRTTPARNPTIRRTSISPSD